MLKRSAIGNTKKNNKQGNSFRIKKYSLCKHFRTAGFEGGHIMNMRLSHVKRGAFVFQFWMCENKNLDIQEPAAVASDIQLRGLDYLAQDPQFNQERRLTPGDFIHRHW